ncbi:MAG: hypothetical protein ACYC9O_12425 [Candidatus Latescibacterota bacterium]
MGELIPIVAILTVFGVPAAVIIVWNVLKHREKMGIMKNGFAPGVEYPGYPGRGTLLWGMIITAVSAVGIVLALVQYDHDWANLHALTLAVGIALLAYWKVTAPYRKQDMEFYERRCHELNTSGKAGE